jgi:predicted phosphodiesterase
MRIAILSDVHGNLTALEAVLADLEQQRPDLVAHGGDLVARGARPARVARAGARAVAPAVYGHIHRPGVRHLGGFTLANSGSVGQTHDQYVATQLSTDTLCSPLNAGQ